MASAFYNLTLRRFQPLAALVRRELLVTLRLKRTWIAMAVLVFILAIFAEDQFPSGAYNLNTMAQQARTFFAIMVMGIYVSCLVFVPGLAATAVTLERERQTYDLVRTSLLTPVAFITGKLLNALGVYLMFIIAAMPLLGFAFFMVGVDVQAISVAAAITFSTAFALAAAGVMCSVFSRSTVRAVTASYVCMVFVMGLHVGIIFMLVATVFQSSATFQKLEVLTLMVPWFVLIRTLGPVADYTYAVYTTAYLVIVGGVTMGIAAWRYVRDVKRDESPMISEPRPFFGRRRRAKNAPRSAMRSMPQGLNTVFWGEFLSMAVSSPRSFLRRVLWFGLLFSFPSLLFVLFFTFGTRDPNAITIVSMGWFVAVGAVVALIITASSANLFTRDVDRGNLDFLRTTLLTNSEVIIGKAMAGAVNAVPMLIAAAVASVPFWFNFDEFGYTIVVMLGGYLMLLMTVLVALCGGMAASAWSKKTTSALSLAIGLNSGVFFVFTFSGALFVSTAMRGLQEPEVALLLMMPSPILGYVPGGILAQSEYAGMSADPAPRLYYGFAAALVQTLLAGALMAVTYFGYVRRSLQE